MACHYDQYEEWKNSRMAHSMDAGVVAQLLIKKNDLKTLEALGYELS
jgi:hypothetical protein